MRLGSSRVVAAVISVHPGSRVAAGITARLGSPVAAAAETSNALEAAASEMAAATTAVAMVEAAVGGKSFLHQESITVSSH
jgi:hypothetical protein